MINPQPVREQRQGCRASYHDTEAAYRHGRCRCPSARRQRRLLNKLRAANLAPPGRIDATGTCRRIQALACKGWDHGRVATEAELGITTVTTIAHGDQRTVLTTSAARLALVYEKLSTTQGPSYMAAAHARDRGWLPPTVWEYRDIDDPDALRDATVDATGSRRKLQGLAWQRWHHHTLAAATQLPPEQLAGIIHGRTTVVLREVAEAVNAVYDQLWDTPGPDTQVGLAARAAGWLPPAAWDDDEIDDPQASPAQPPQLRVSEDVDWVKSYQAARGEPVSLNLYEQRLAIELMWPDLSLTTPEIARRAGSNVDRVEGMARRRKWPRRDGNGQWLRRTLPQHSNTTVKE